MFWIESIEFPSPHLWIPFKTRFRNQFNEIAQPKFDAEQDNETVDFEESFGRGGSKATRPSLSRPRIDFRHRRNDKNSGSMSII